MIPQSRRYITAVYLFWQNPLLYTQLWNYATIVCIFITPFLIGNVLLTAKQQFIPLKIQNLFEVWFWGQNSQGSLSPYELLTTFPLNVTVQLNTKFLIWKPKPCKPLDSNILNVILNNRCQVHLKPLKKINSDAKMYYKFFFSNFPHSWPCFSHFVTRSQVPS